MSAEEQEHSSSSSDDEKSEDAGEAEETPGEAAADGSDSDAEDGGAEAEAADVAAAAGADAKSDGEGSDEGAKDKDKDPPKTPLKKKKNPHEDVVVVAAEATPDKRGREKESAGLMVDSGGMSDDAEFLDIGLGRSPAKKSQEPDSDADSDDEAVDVFDEPQDEQEIGVDERWDLMIRPDDKGDYFYEDRTGVPTILVILSVLAFGCGTCCFIVVPLPWVPSRWWVLIGLAVCILCCILGAGLVVGVLLKTHSTTTTFADHLQSVVVTKKFVALPFINTSERIPYTSINEFVMYRMGERGGNKMISRYVVYLKRQNGEEMPLTRPMKFEKDAILLATTLNEALVSKLPI